MNVVSPAKAMTLRSGAEYLAEIKNDGRRTWLVTYASKIAFANSVSPTHPAVFAPPCNADTTPANAGCRGMATG